LLPRVINRAAIVAVSTLCPFDFSVMNAMGGTNAPMVAVNTRMVVNDNDNGYSLNKM
jgi:hypothetical protein